MDGVSQSKKRVLVVNDQPASREALRELLCISGFAVEVIASADSVGEKLVEGRFEAVVSDLLAPAEGRVVLAAVRAVQPDTPVVIVAARDPAPKSPGTDFEGAFGVLEKPVEWKHLLAALEDACARVVPERG
jgi:DNA-binding NtrC family response regulator